MEIAPCEILTAHERIKEYIHNTPVLTSELINEISGAGLFFKCENFQKIGAFKIRGGLNAALQLPGEKLKNGLATHSSGNHAQAIAYAAKVLKTKAYIVMPENSPKVKVNAVKGYGAEIFFCDPTLQAREDTMREVIAKTGAEFIHPYNDERIIAGQATAAKEMIDYFEEKFSGKFDAIFAPVGGGGLLSGTLLSAEYFSKGTEVFAGEPEGAADAVYSVKSGKIEKAKFIKTVADGLLTTLGDKTLPIIKKYVKEIILVSDEEIMSALYLVYERLKIVIEPSSAVAFAAFLKRREEFRRKKVGIIFSGGNVDLVSLSSV
jgi:threonine dehydratase